MSRAAVEREMLGRLGLTEAAGPEDVEAAYGDLVAFLESAPHELRGWAATQIASADEAYAVLSDPTASVAPRTVAGAPANPPAAHKGASKTKARAAAVAAPPAPRDSLRSRLGRRSRLLVAMGAVLATFAVGYIVYASDVPAVPGLTGTPRPESSLPALDTARVAELMQAIEANDKDVVALQELADLYFDSGDYETSADFEDRVLAVNPNDITAHLAIGAAAYNSGDSSTAEQHWRRVLELDPDNVEAHYDLGFMYFSADPPDVDQTIAEWRRVVEIAPDSDVAQTVSTHLQTLEEWQAAESAAPTRAPASAAPASPAASAASPEP